MLNITSIGPVHLHTIEDLVTAANNEAANLGKPTYKYHLCQGRDPMGGQTLWFLGLECRQSLESAPKLWLQQSVGEFLATTWPKEGEGFKGCKTLSAIVERLGRDR